jgi:hypothetical protein
VATVIAMSRLGRLGIVSLVIAGASLIAAFIPIVTIAAAVCGLVGLSLGLTCLIRDPGFNLPALGGTLASSAAVSAAMIMTVVYAG